MSRGAALETSGQELKGGSFASSFPKRFSTALDSARGAMEGIDSMSDEAGGRGMIDIDSLREYHEIYRLRIELELETAAVLWRAAEAAWALLDVGEALSRKLEGERGATLAESVIRRRASIVVPRPPFVEREAATQDAPAQEPPAIQQAPPAQPPATPEPPAPEAPPPPSVPGTESSDQPPVGPRRVGPPGPAVKPYKQRRWKLSI